MTAHLKLVQSVKIPPKDTVSAGLRAFFNIARNWRLTDEEAMVLLGQPARSTFYNWKKGKIARATNSLDLATRIGTLLGIFKSLEILYTSPVFADRWIKQPNEAFGGQSALERMMAGQITDLATVRSYLDSARGAW